MHSCIGWGVAAVALLGAAVAGAGDPIPVSHTDNGRRIFLHGTTASGRVVQNSHGMEGVGCAMCHGEDGRGGMMHGIPAPDITFSNLTDSNGHEHEFSNRRHPAFTRETIKAAVVAGIDPAGNTLHEEMPRWIGLNGADLEDLIDYLQALSKPHRRPPPGPERM
jgi:mono/diheme cytochrome c family protein